MTVRRRLGEDRGTDDQDDELLREMSARRSVARNRIYKATIAILDRTLDDIGQALGDPRHGGEATLKTAGAFGAIRCLRLQLMDSLVDNLTAAQPKPGAEGEHDEALPVRSVDEEDEF